MPAQLLFHLHCTTIHDAVETCRYCLFSKPIMHAKRARLLIFDQNHEAQLIHLFHDTKCKSCFSEKNVNFTIKHDSLFDRSIVCYGKPSLLLASFVLQNSCDCVESGKILKLVPLSIRFSVKGIFTYRSLRTMFLPNFTNFLSNFYDCNFEYTQLQPNKLLKKRNFVVSRTARYREKRLV